MYILHVDQEEADGRIRRINCSEMCLECLWRKGEEAGPRLSCLHSMFSVVGRCQHI